MSSATLSQGQHFRLIGNTTVFIAAQLYLAAGFIPSVRGVTLDGTKQTCARLADIQPLPAVPVGENALPLFGERLRMLGLGATGRLYFDRWAQFDGKAQQYLLTGFGATRRITRTEAAQVLRSVRVRTLALLTANARGN